MATDADISLAVNEAREEHVGLPTVEGEHFLKSPLTDEVANNIAPNVSKLVEKTFAEESQQNAEESNSKDGDGDRGVVLEKCSTDPSVVTSDMKVGDTDDDPCTDGAIAVTQLSNETSCDHHGTYDSTTKNVALTKEILLESSLPSKEAESHTPCISEGDHNAPKFAEKSEESLPVQVEDSQVVCDEHFEEESERLPLAEVSTGGTNENIILKATDNVKDKDKDLKEAELSENEQTTSTLVKDMHKENPAESFYVSPENIEVSDLSEENSVKAPPEEQSRNETLHGDTNKEEEATIIADDGQKESVEGFPPIVSSSHKERSINAVLQEATGDHTYGKISDKVDNHKKVLENLSSGEGHCKATNISPDISKDTEKTDKTVRDGSDTFVDRPVELATTEETHVKVIQRNAEEYNSSDRDGGRDVIPEVCSIDSSVATSETKVGDTLVYPDMDGTEVATKLPKDTSSDHHGTNDSSTTDVALTEEILQEADLPSRETESHTPCISEAEEPNFQVKTTDNKYVDEKPTEEDIPCIIRNEVSKEAKSDHNKIASEQDELENERSVENSTSGETIIALENSNANKLQSKSDLNSSLSKEEGTDLQKSVEPVTTPEDYRVPSEKTLSESHGDVECKSETMEDAATDHSDPMLVEKSEESSVVQVTDSQIDHNEHLGEDREGLSLKEASTGDTNDNATAATDEVKEQSEEHKEAELLENEQSTKYTLVNEDTQIENLAESLHVEVSNISQGNNIEVLPEVATIDVAEGQKGSQESFPPIVSGSPEEGSLNAVLQEVTSDDTDDKIVDESDKHEEASENLSTTVSTEDAEGISLVKMESSENKRGDDSAEESEETPLPLLSAREISDASVQEALFEDGEPNKAKFYDDERDTESFLLKTETRTENTEDVHGKPEDTKAPDLVDKSSEGGTLDAAAKREETVENVTTIVPDENTEEHFDKENEQVSSIEESSGAELFEKDKNSECVLLTEEVQSEIPAENIKTSDFDQHAKEMGILEEKILTEKSQRIPSDEEEEKRIDAATTNKKTQELQNVLNENSDKDLLIKVAASEMTHDIKLEEEPERPPLTEIAKKEACENESILLEPKISDEYPSTVELPKDEKSTDYTTPKKESLQPEDHKTSTSSGDIETSCSLEEQTLEDNSQTIICDKNTDAGEADKNDLALENVAKETPCKDIEESSVTQVECSAREHGERVEEEKQSSSLIEVLVDETNARESKNTDEPKNRGKESITPEMENENRKNTYGKEETDVETPIDFLQVKPEDIKQHDPSPDINKSIKEEISNADPLAISTDKAQRESVDVAHTHEENVETKDVAKDIPDSGKKDSIPIEEFGSQNPTNEASGGNANGKESTKITEESLITKEEPLKSLQVEDKDIETPPASRDRDRSSLHEESPTTNPETIMDDNKEEMPYNATGKEDETSKDKDIVEDTSDCDKEDNMPTEELGSQNPLNGASAGNTNIEESTKTSKGDLINEEASVQSLQEAAQGIETDHLSREREISSPDEESPIVNLEGIRDESKEEIATSETTLEVETHKDKQSIANTTPYEDKEESMQVQEDCSQWEQNASENIPSSEAPAVSSIESSPVKEEEKVEIPTKEQILTADPQETCDETQEKTIDAANKNNDVVISVPNRDSDDNSPVEVDGLQEPPSEEVPAEKINDDEPTTSHETKFAYENTVKGNLNEDEEKIECAPVKEDVYIESSQVADDDIKGTSSGHDREANPVEEQTPTTDSKEAMDDEIYTKPLDSTDLKQEILEDGKYATTPDEDTKEDSQNQTDDFILESEEQSVKDSESTSVSDTPKDDITESTLVKEVAEVEDPIDSSQVATEDIKAFAPRQDAESSIVEQILDPTTVENETPKDEVPKEMDSADVKEETKEEEGYIKAVEMTTAVTLASNQMTSNKHVSDSTSLESEVLEKINDQIVGEANSFGDETDLEKIEVLNDGPTAIPISETLAETASRGCTETEDQLPNVEKEAEVSKREAENDQKHIKETLPNDAVSEDIVESKKVTGEEVSSNDCKEITSSPISVSSEDVLTSNVALEEDSTSNSVTDLETNNEEVPAIKEKTPSSVEGQDAESTIVEKNSNYACILTEKKSDSTEVAFMPGENKSGYESDKRSLESIAQGQSFNIISETGEPKAEDEDLKAESGIQSDKAVIEDTLQEETTREKEIVKDNISSEKEQLPRTKEEHEDVKEYHQGSCELKVPEVSEEADDKAPEDLQEKIFTNEAIDRILHQDEQATSIEEPTTKIDNENVCDLDIECVNTDTQDSNKETVQIAIIPGKESEEQNKEDEICSSDEVQEVHEETLILSEGKSKEEAKETYNEAYLEAEKFDSSPQTKNISKCAVRDVGPDTPEDNEKSTTGSFSEEDYPKNITKCEVSSASEDVALTEQPSEDASITAELQEAKKIGEFTEGTPLEAENQLTKDIALTEQPSEDTCIIAEVQEAKAGIDLGAAVPVPRATGSESQEVEKLNDKCTEMADTSTPVETSVTSTSKNIEESTEGTPLEAENQQTKLHDLPEESNKRVNEVKTAEKDDAVNIQSIGSISEDVQELCKETFGVSSHHNPAEGEPEERTETSDGQKTNPIQAALVLETPKQEIEEQKLGRDNVDVHEEEKNTYSIPNQLESLNGADTEKVPESSIHQSFVEDTAQHEKKEGIQKIDSPLFLPRAQCSDIITSENEPAHFGGLGSTGVTELEASTGVTELEASPLSLKDRHVVLEAGDTRNLIPENLDGDKNISTEHFQGEHEVVKPSKVEQEEDECGNKDRKDQQMERKTESEETDKPSLSDLLHVSTRGTTEMEDHSPTEKEPTRHTENMPAQNIDEADHENMKTDEEKDDEEESHEQKKSDLGSEAPVMVDIGDADIKVAHKKSHNILSGVGSKVKHSIAKVKKAIIGKSPSPKKATISESK
ncbi:microtubule-associated protein futsch-like isoform X1 [Salvia divinorum]|uniref:Microtubule-associated protein futsch-like isoform X1 n=1 Tax=Salvia divinorum TaxID=28513 RepID=A0ABD1FXB3_SALDI